ncbi:hypothetical protein ABK040_012771 [Willaertia magna]
MSTSLNKELFQQLNSDELLVILSFLNTDRKTLCNFNYLSKTFIFSTLSNHDDLWANYYKETINNFFSEDLMKENQVLREEKNKLLQKHGDFKIGIIDFNKSILVKSALIQKENILKLQQSGNNYNDCKLLTINEFLQKKNEILKKVNNTNGIVPSVKTVAIGDAKAGKTSFFYVFTETQMNTSQLEYLPKHFGGYSCNFSLTDEKNCNYSVNLGLWDTSGEDQFDNVRKLEYGGTSVFIICFSVVDHNSFERVTTKWKKEIASFNVPIILCGCKTDLRNDKKEIFKLLQKNLAPITKEEGEFKAKEIEAVGYIETSSWTGVGFGRQLLDYVLLWGLVGEKIGVENFRKRFDKGCFIQ